MGRLPVLQAAEKLVSTPASKLAGDPVSTPASKLAGDPVSTPASKLAGDPVCGEPTVHFLGRSESGVRSSCASLVASAGFAAVRLARSSCFYIFCGFLGVTALPAQISRNLQQMITTLVANERNANLHKQHFLYTSVERSDRTGGHVWTDRVVETAQGKLRYLIAEDGHPLSPERHAEELARLKTIEDDPAAFVRREQARRNDEQHAQQMLELLPRAFLFDSAGTEGPYLRINFRPNPAYDPDTYEERVLHSMSGMMLVDPDTLRLHHLEGRLNNNVSFAYGLLATIHSGGGFETTRDLIAPGTWKTTLIDTHIDGRAIFFKTISLHQQSEHRDFQPVPGNLTIPQAIQLLEK
jgi:hypothetical protein